MTKGVGSSALICFVFSQSILSLSFSFPIPLRIQSGRTNKAEKFRKFYESVVRVSTKSVLSGLMLSDSDSGFSRPSINRFIALKIMNSRNAENAH